jgi:histidyl-tRNA synthetase
MPAFQPVRGMRDLLPEDAALLNYIVCKARETACLFGYKEVVTPVVESYELLSAKSGEEIRSRMFVFKDLGNRTVALRPEFTASIARLATTTLRNEPKPLRLFSVGSVYRYDEPQRGRYREFWQSNFELVGSARPEADAEVILLTDSLLRAVGLQSYAFKLGNVGVLRAILSQEGVDEKTQNMILQLMDKKEYDEAFKLVKPEKCRALLSELLELKAPDASSTVEKMREKVKGYTEAEAAAYNLAEVLRLVTEGGCNVQTVEPTFARGLEYYTGMIFEVYVPQLEIALGGGGRYDRLIEVFGGEPTPAVGVAHGIDRIALALQMQEKTVEPKHGKKVMVIPVNEQVKSEALKLAMQLRSAGVPTEFEVMRRRVAKALEDADRRRIDYAVIIGEKELRAKTVTLRDMAKRLQETVPIQALAEKIMHEA